MKSGREEAIFVCLFPVAVLTSSHCQFLSLWKRYFCLYITV